MKEKWKIERTFFILSLLSIAHFGASDIPLCDYFDTVDLTDIKPFDNGSYAYQDIIIPKNLTAEYDYEILFEDRRVEVPMHIRGCACKIKPCLRYCCPPHQALKNDSRECIDRNNTEINYDPYVTIVLSNDSLVSMLSNSSKYFVIQLGLPIPFDQHYPLQPEEYEDEDTYRLYEDGNLYMGNEYYTKGDYCLEPTQVAGEEYEIKVHKFYIYRIKWDRNVQTYLMILSVICMIPTIIVYITLPQLRNLHGQCFVCYLISLSVAYSMMIFVQFGVPESLCKPTGYLGYFGTLAAFLWLSVISFDLFKRFRSFNHTSYRYTFLIYNLYSWGIATAMTVLIIVIDAITDRGKISSLWIPGVESYICWINTNSWSPMVYLFGPMLCLMLFNITMFILTAKYIIKVKKDLQIFATFIDRRRQLQVDHRNYKLFMRLVVVMGLSWIMEILSYLIHKKPEIRHIFCIFDFMNSSVGIIILILFILNRRVRYMIKDRFETHRSVTGSSSKITKRPEN